MTAEQIAQRAYDLNLITDRQRQELWSSFGSHDIDAEQMTQTLLGREFLTNFQLKKLLEGDRTGFYYGEHKVLYLVAAGTFARVYRAVHPETNRVVALKVLRKRFCDEPDKVDLFHREGELGRQLRHPNIVPIFDVVGDGRIHYLVMELVEGGNFRDLIKIRKKLDPEEAIRFMIDVASGLHYAYGRGICHRDLKLTNVLISSRGTAKLIDFGLAGEDQPGDDSSGVDRTIDYAGLERATGVRRDDKRSDVYFMGCILYHLLTGKSPLTETRDRVQRLSRQRFEQVPPIRSLEPDLPRVVVRVVERAMDLDAKQRYQMPGHMLVDLKMAAQRLKEGTDISESEADDTSVLDGTPNSDALAGGSILASMIPDDQRRALMFVESSTKMQDIFREGLKKVGYRVLVTVDPQRALARFEQDAATADCVIFSSGTIGQSALEAFNQFGRDEATANIPAVLILSSKQGKWAAHAETGDHRRVVSMPIKLRNLRALLNELVPITNPADLSAE